MSYASLWKIRVFGFPITYSFIKDWRQAQYEHGKPSRFKDFWTAHGACPTCGGSGRVSHTNKIFGFIVIATYSWPCDHCLVETISRIAA
jgi:hypothetical protein